MQDRRATRRDETERRSEPRVAMRGEVEFTVGGVTYSATAEDMSLKGVFVATEVEVFDGLTAEVTLYPAEDADPIKLDGTIVRLARRRDERPGFAVEFRSMNDATRERIRTAVERG